MVQILTNELQKDKIYLFSADYNDDDSTMILEIGNKGYNYRSDAIARASFLADKTLPKKYKNFQFVIKEKGFNPATVSTIRQSLIETQNEAVKSNQIKILPGRKLQKPQKKSIIYKSSDFVDLSLGTKFHVFDPDQPLMYKLFGLASTNIDISNGWRMNTSYLQNLSSDFHKIQRSTDSTLPHVRSDIKNYYQKGKSGLESLFLEKFDSLSSNTHYRLFSGILEQMYSGAGGEILFQPFSSRLGYGMSGHYVKKEVMKEILAILITKHFQVF